MDKKFWIGMGVSAVLIFFLFKGIDYGKLYETTSHANLYLWIPAFLLQYPLMLIRALRWHHLLKPLKRIGTYNLFVATTIGFMSNNLLPARMGEFVRAYVIGSKEDVRFTSAFATIVVERIFDVMSVLTMTVLVFLFMDLPEGVSGLKDTIRAGAVMLLLACVLVATFLYLLVSSREKALIIARRLLSPLPARFQEQAILFIDSLATGMEVVKDWRAVSAISAYSAINWLVCAVPIYIIIHSFGFSLPFSASLLILILLAFAVSMPSSPGFVGPFHGAVFLGLGFYGVGKEEAIGMAIVMHLAQFVPLVILGLFLVWSEKISFGQIKKMGPSSAA